MNEVYLNDVGTRIEFDVDLDVDEINKAIIYYKKADGTKGEWEAKKDSEKNVIYYVSDNEDFNITGLYKLQIYIELDDWRGRSEVVDLLVKDVV